MTKVLRSSSAATVRRVVLLGLAVLVALLASNAAAPADANAAVPTPVRASYVGWAYTKGGPRLCSGTGRSYTCGVAPTSAWRWTGSTWVHVTLAAGSSVYVTPYSGAWHWAWHRSHGWLAIQTASLERRCGSGWAVAC